MAVVSQERLHCTWLKGVHHGIGNLLLAHTLASQTEVKLRYVRWVSYMHLHIMLNKQSDILCALAES